MKVDIAICGTIKIEERAMAYKGWIVESPGGEFREIELPSPTLEKNQVLVRISASAVNPLDTKIRAGKAAHARQSLPAVLGLDMAGTVEEVGSGVTTFSPADDVYGMVGGVSTGGEGFDTVYDTVGGATLDASFNGVKQYTGHVLSCLGWGMHSLAPLSFRGATYSGVFTLFPLITGQGRAHHGEILTQAARLAEAGKLKPLMSEQCFSTADIAAAHALVESGALGKVVVEFQRVSE
jgi:NADPH:quinone reductase-like Zn-dependent oxidoreductase